MPLVILKCILTYFNEHFDILIFQIVVKYNISGHFYDNLVNKTLFWI